MRKIALVVISTLLLSGCGAAKVDMYRADAGNNAVFSDGVQTLHNLKWKFSSQSEIKTATVVSDDVAYFGNTEGYVFAVNVADGREKWRLKTSGPIGGAPAISEGVLYIGSQDGSFYAINTATGQQVWKFPSSGSITTSPVLLEGTLYFANVAGDLYAVEARTGREQWRYQSDSAIYSSPAVANGLVVFGSDSGKLFAVEKDSGVERWRFATEGKIHADPTVFAGTVYVGSQDATLYAVDINTGQQTWRYRAEASQSEQTPHVGERAYMVVRHRCRVPRGRGRSTDQHGAHAHALAAGDVGVERVADDDGAFGRGPEAAQCRLEEHRCGLAHDLRQDARGIRESGGDRAGSGEHAPALDRQAGVDVERQQPAAPSEHLQGLGQVRIGHGRVSTQHQQLGLSGRRCDRRQFRHRPPQLRRA